MARLFFLSKPSEAAIGAFIADQSGLPFSYPNPGMTKTGRQADFIADHYRVRLGEGSDVFEKAKAAVDAWAMFRLSWVSIHGTETFPHEGRTVAVLARAGGLWVLNATRVVYRIDEKGRVDKHGFAYGTLPGHAEKGEERFSVEWRREDNSVWFEILALSRPNHVLCKLVSPYVRLLQKQFGRDALEAMRSFISH